MNPQTTSLARRDFDLMKRAQKGDSTAFGDLFSAHKGRVYSLCLRMTNNVSEAEDLVQDAFLQVFRNLSAFRGESAFSTWLYRVTVNTVLMHYRRKRPLHTSLDATYEGADDARPAKREYGHRDARLESSALRVALARAISELPAGARAIFVLHEIEGYQHREIAGFLGCSVGTSKSQLHKARMKIRECIARRSRATGAAEVPERRWQLASAPSLVPSLP